MDVRITAGRGFREGDGEGQPRVVVINEALARREFAGEDPLGRLVYIGRDAIPWLIVGIVEDIRQFGLDQEPQPQFFVDVRQWPATTGVLFPVGAYYAVRTSSDDAFGPLVQIRSVIRQMDSQAALFNVASMEDLVLATVSRPRMYAVLIGIFATVGAVLAVIGIYGLLTYLVARRTREIGIRIALGAHRRTVLALILRHGMIVTVVGVLCGLAGAAALTRYLEGMLFGVTPADAATYVSVVALFAAVAAMASLLPHVEPRRSIPSSLFAQSRELWTSNHEVGSGQ
jgi:ABC-type antimicrobial peptide transport system permease subunit